ncbi:MAG TPA: PKD domain-containing protein [Gammaproteobacteria bacterium]
MRPLARARPSAPAALAALLLASPAALGQALVCDADTDGDVDQLDIQAIFAARGTPASGPNDPRDSIRDGTITLNDGAVCVRSCTLAGCPVITPTPNTAPVADAGDDQTVVAGETVTLDGSGSFDADGDPLMFSWSLVSAPPGSAAGLSDAAAVTPTFVADLPGAYAARLVVNDGRADSMPDEVVIVTEPVNTPPVADAGPDQTVLVGDTVQLDGSGSTDVDGDALAFAWSLVTVPAGSGAALSDPSAVDPTFTADLAGDYVVELVVSDGLATSPADSVTVTTGNSPPAADAGPDQTVALAALVTLDGSASTDADGDPLSFAWSLTAVPAGSTAVLGSADTPAPTFVADVAGTYVAQLIVSDGTASSAPDTVVVTTSNTRPVADAGDDQSVEVGDTVQLDGSGSFDADGDALTFAWSLTVTPAGSAAALSDDAAVAPTFVADEAGTYVAQLIVSDGELASDPDTVVITTEAPPELPTVTVTAPDDVAAELGGDTGTFTITRTGETTDSLTVRYVMLGTPVNGVDYVALPGTITIPAGAANASITLEPIADTEVEGTESALLEIQADPSYLTTTPSLASIQITDSVVVTVAATDASASEATLDPAGFTFTRAGGNLGAPLIVFYARSGAANNPLFPNDTALPLIVTIPAGETSVVVPVTPVRDNRVEGDEDLTLTISPNVAYVVGAPSSATITIDDDPPIVSIEATTALAAEAGPVSGVFTFTRVGGDPAAALNVQCGFSGTAGNSADYVFTGCNTTIPANAASATRTITPRADNVVEGPETVVATLEPSISQTYLVGSPSTATITIADDPAVVAITATDPSAAEAGSDPGVLTVTRSGGNVAADLPVVFSRAGTAAGADFSGFTLLLDIPANQASVEMVITPVDDMLVEGDETVTVTVSPANRYVIGTPGTATVTIADDD